MTMMPTLPEHIAGVVLAGGKSSRMGRDKAALDYAGTPLLEYMQHVLREAGLHHVYTSGQDGIADLLPGRGPLSGVHAALQEAGDKYRFLLFVPVDMPGLTPDLLRELAGVPEQMELVRFADYALPFRLEANADVLMQLETILSGDGGYSLKGWQQRLGLHCMKLEKDEEASFANINTPEQWRKFKEAS